MEYIAVDIGTSFTKGALVDVESFGIRNIKRRTAPAPLDSSNPLFHEQDPLLIVDSVKDIVAELHVAADDCCGILICGQMGGLVLCSEDGVCQRPYISWLDRRATAEHPSQSGSIFESLQQATGDRAKGVFGGEFRPGLPLSFLYSLLVTDELKEHRDAIPVTLPDFVAAALCHTRPVMEWTGATGLVDVEQRCFPVEFFGELGLNGLTMPELVDFRHCVGEFVSSGTSLPVYAATGDHQCSLAGTLLEHSELSINISTGSQVSQLTTSAEAGEYQVRPYFDGQLLKTITNIPAGRALTALMKLFTEIGGHKIDSADAWTYFFLRAEEVTETDLHINLAFFPGSIPGPGSLQNLREDNLTVGHVARASLEQMADYYQQLARRIDPSASRSRLAFSGGIAQRSSLLRQLISARLETDFRTAATSEDSLFGMIVLGRVIAGLNDSVAEAVADARRHSR